MTLKIKFFEQISKLRFLANLELENYCCYCFAADVLFLVLPNSGHTPTRNVKVLFYTFFSTVQFIMFYQCPFIFTMVKLYRRPTIALVVPYDSELMLLSKSYCMSAIKILKLHVIQITTYILTEGLLVQAPAQYIKNHTVQPCIRMAAFVDYKKARHCNTLHARYSNGDCFLFPCTKFSEFQKQGQGHFKKVNFLGISWLLYTNDYMH